jgi:predicted Zn-dependent peptidase
MYCNGKDFEDVDLRCICFCRTQLKAEYLMSLESSAGLLDAMGSQALSGGVYHSPEAIAQKIDSVSATDVANVSLFTLG